MTAPAPQRRRLWLACAVALYLAIGYAPDNVEDIPRPQANGARLTADGTLRFESAGIAQLGAPPPWAEEARRSKRFEVELEAQPANAQQGGPARLFTWSYGTQDRNVTIGQEGRDLHVRVRTERTNANGVPAYVVRNFFEPGRWVRIRLVIEGARLTLDCGGARVAEETFERGPLELWDPDYPAALGNEVFGQRPWLGEIRRAVVRAGEKTFGLLEPPVLELPRRYWVYGNPTQVPIWGFGNPDRSRARDWSMNLAGFVPLGALFYLCLGRRPSLARAVLGCFLVSLAIEAGQFFLPWRSTQLSDLLLNTLGGALGALGGHFWLGRR